MIALTVLVVLVGNAAAFAPPPCGTTIPTAPLQMATWSDSKAVREYQDFLSSGKQEIELTSDSAAVILRPAEGPCQLADGLLRMGMGDDFVLAAGQELPESSPALPIYITLPPTQLKEFLSSLPDSLRTRRDDFVFFSGFD